MTITSVHLNLILPNGPKVELPAVLTIAGSDSSGGAGIEADVKTMTAHEVYGLTCITALTAQNTLGVSAVVETPKSHVDAILSKNFDDLVEGYTEPILKVVKTGMLTKDATEVLIGRFGYLESKGIKLLVDPVMVSTSGRVLTDTQTMQLCQNQLIPQAYLCTPNYLEAIHLWKLYGESEPEIETVDQFAQFVVRLQDKLGCSNLLVKGGHIPWLEGRRHAGEGNSSLEIVDILFQSDLQTTTIIHSAYITSDNSHGTGCTLASAIASNLAKGKPLQLAVTLSIDYVHRGMVELKEKIGHGKGPLNHTVHPRTSVNGVLKGESLKPVINKHGSMVDFLKTHPKVKANWQNYVEHEFLRLVATNRLPFERFLFYLKQDYYYLVNYAQMHGIAASVAPTCEQIQAQSVIIEAIMTEIGRHKEKLKTGYNIVYEDSRLDAELEPAASCIAYCDYLLQLGKTEDFLGIKVALAPCLHGYAEAGQYGKRIRQSHDPLDLGVVELSQADAYAAWLDDYTSEWYNEADKNGRAALDEICLRTDVSPERLDELVEIFNRATVLEVEFWDAVTRTST